MNKYVFLPVLALILGLTGSVSAITNQTCGDPVLNHPDQFVWNGVSTTTIPAINNVNCDGGMPDNVSSAWGTNKDVPHLVAGATTSDEGGISYTCPAFYSQACVDITHTSYYRMMMNQLGAQLKAMGVTGGMFAYWIK